MNPADRKWEPVLPVKPVDSVGHKAHRAFIPSYDKGRPNMYSLMTMYYRRLWFEERELWQQKVYPPAENQSFQRTYVKRKSKKKTLDVSDFKIKKFKNISSKADHKRPAKA